MITFEGMVWEPDRLRWRGHTFLLEAPDGHGGQSDGLVLWKSPGLIAQYRTFWHQHPDFACDRVLELGLWKGGSLAFWAEALQPSRLVGMDLRSASSSPAFDAYLAAQPERLRAYWGVDQGDADRIRGIVAANFDGPLDLVIDDASHLYGPTRASFEAVFPLLRPGGLYIIEDWAWHHWPSFQSVFAGQIPLTRLVTELAEAVGSSGLVMGLAVYQGFVAVRRGPGACPEPFTLDAVISRGPEGGRSLRRMLSELAKELRSRF
jgi:SAM-dependent methyltransferase